MRVALDGTPLAAATGGIRCYTEELSRALAGEFPEDEYWLVSDQEISLAGVLPPNLHIGTAPTSRFHRRWWSYGVLVESWRVGVEVFHGTDFATPYLPLRPSVLTLHDLSPWKNADWGASDRVRRRTPFLIGLRLATMIITPSERIRREAAEWFGLPLSSLVAVPLAVAPSYCPTEPTRRANPYFLYVGVLEPRKNIPLIVEAWRELRREHAVDLVLAGRRRADCPGLAAEPGLILLGEVAESDLPPLYSGAVAFLYPSFYEGFGLPVLEAMACGAMVITSRDPALRELGGDATLQLDTADCGAWTAAMKAALEEPGWRAEAGNRALRRSAQYRWPETARRTRAVYQEARRRFGG